MKKMIDYNRNQSAQNLQKAVIVGLPLAISLIINMVTLPPPWGIITPFAYLLVMSPFWIKQIRNIGVEPSTYFLNHPWMVDKPKELLNFQIDKMQALGVPFKTEGAAETWLGGNPIPRDIIVEGKVYRYTMQPNGVRFNWTNKMNSFWMVHDSWVYVGKEGNVPAQEPVEMRQFSTGLFGREKWYYIVYHGGDNGGFDLIALCNAVWVFDAEGNVIDLKVQEFIEQMKEYGGVLEKVDDRRVALYFSDRDGAEKAKDWITSRWTALQFMKSS